MYFTNTMNNKLVFRIVFLFIFSSTNFVAQNNGVNLKTIWENPKNPDSTRFYALQEFYKKNTSSQPDYVLTLTDFHIELAQKNNNKKELINALSEKSFAYYIKDNIKKSEQSIREAIKIQITLNDKVALARLFTNLASICRAQSKFVETIRYYNYALQIFESFKEEKLEATVLGNIGLVYFDLKNHQIALNYFEKSLKIYTKLKLQDKIGYISLYMGGADFENKNYKQSIKNLEKALHIFKESNDQFASIDCYYLLAKSFHEINKNEEAFKSINKGLALSQKLENTTRIIQNKIFLAELYLESDIIKATQLGEEVIPTIDESIDKKTKASLYNLLYNCYKKSEKRELSHKMYDKYVVYNDSVLRDQSNLELIKEAVNQEFKIKLLKNKQSFEQSENDLKRNQSKKLLIIIVTSLIIISILFIYFRKKSIQNQKMRAALLEEIKKLKSNDATNIVVNSNEFTLNREKIESFINRKLNDTDWNVLNILLKEPDISNKEIAEKAFLSVDGIGSSLRRMYLYFDIKESKYKKISLITEAIKASSK